MSDVAKQWLTIPAGRRESKAEEGQFSFSTGARGFLVSRLQATLRINPDGIYGKATAARVQQLQLRYGFRATGQAGPGEFRATGLEWPSDFERCMNLVSNFEGTSFGDCNATDIDGAGLTMGIAGFTSAHGEVQALLAHYFSARPQMLQQVLPLRETDLLMRYFAAVRPSSAAAKEIFFERSGAVKECWRRAIAALGQDVVMQRLQLMMAHERFWARAAPVAKRLGFASLRAKCFFLDVAVQNGGWRRDHEVAVLREPGWHSGDERVRLSAAATAVAACAKAKWRTDVLSRKLAIAQGEGMVHARWWNLAAHGVMEK